MVRRLEWGGVGGARLWTELLFGRRQTRERDGVLRGAVPAAAVAAAATSVASVATVAAAAIAAAAISAAAAVAADRAAALLSDHLLQRIVSKGSWLEPQLFRWHHA